MNAFAIKDQIRIIVVTVLPHIPEGYRLEDDMTVDCC